MHVLIGLGNPGARYARTRHNLGFMTVDQLALRANAAWEEKRSDPPYAVAPWGRAADGNFWLLIKPYTFMNESGRAVATYARMSKLPPSNIWIVHDDVDLPVGELREAMGSGSAGHRGVESVILELGTKDFRRLRIGVGRPEDPNLPTDAFVLEKADESTLTPLAAAAADWFLNTVLEKKKAPHGNRRAVP